MTEQKSQSRNRETENDFNAPKCKCFAQAEYKVKIDDKLYPKCAKCRKLI